MSVADLDQRCRPYEPHGACRQLFSCRDHEVAIAGPAGTGKTRAVLELILYWAEHYPGARILLCRATRMSMNESVLPIWEQHVLPEGHHVLVGPHRSNRQGYSFANGAQVILGGLDHSERLLSMELDAVCIFQAEEVGESDFELLVSRLRHDAIGYRQAVLDLNPTHPGHWVKQRCDEGRMTLLTSTHRDNPMLWSGGRWTPQGEEYMQRLQTLSGVQLARLYRGEWAGLSGLVYPGFRRDVHVVERFDPPWHRRLVAIDFGYSNPTAIVWAALDEDDRVYVYRVHYKPQTLVATWAEMINRCRAEDERAIKKGVVRWTFVADHDAEGRAQLAAAGIDTRSARKDILTGIEVVQQRLEVQGDAKPRLFVMKDSLAHPPDPQLRERHLPTDLVGEIERYQWAEPREGTNEKELPQDFANHAMDALRYLCMEAESPGVPLPTRRIPNPPKNPRWVYELDHRHVERLYDDHYHHGAPAYHAQG